MECALSNIAVTRFITEHRDDIAMVVVSNPFRKHGAGGIRGMLRHFRNSGLHFSVFLAYVFFFYPKLLNAGYGMRKLLGITGPRTPIRQLCRKLGVEYVCCGNINDTQVTRLMQQQRIDLIVTCFFDQILAPEIIAAARKMCLNVHPGLLPETRGVFPEFHAASGNGPGFGFTIHVIDTPAIDAGMILTRKNLDMAGMTSMLAIGRNLLEEGLAALGDTLIDLDAGLAGAAAQGPGNYFTYPSREDIRRLRRAGYELLRLRDICGDIGWIFRVH